MSSRDPLDTARIALALIDRLPPRADGGHVVLITSAATGEGKTFVTEMLAKELAPAASGEVVIVSTSLSSVAVHRAASSAGFTTLVATGILDAAVVMATNTPQLFYVPPGETERKVSFFHPAGVERALARLRSSFRLSLIDGPVLVECGAMLEQADMVLLVVDTRTTSPRVIRRAMARASIGAGDVHGTILNRTASGLPIWLGGD